MPESVCNQLNTLPLQLVSRARGKSDLNTEHIDIWFAMFWKDMEVQFKKKCEQKPWRKNFDGKWRMTVYNWLKVKLLYCSSIK